MRTGKARHLRAIGGRGRPSPPKDEVLQIPARLVEDLCNLGKGEDQDDNKNMKSRVQSERIKDQLGEKWQVVRRRGVQDHLKRNTANNHVREFPVRPWHVLPHRPFQVGRAEH